MFLSHTIMVADTIENNQMNMRRCWPVSRTTNFRNQSFKKKCDILKQPTSMAKLPVPYIFNETKISHRFLMKFLFKLRTRRSKLQPTKTQPFKSNRKMFDLVGYSKHMRLVLESSSRRQLHLYKSSYFRSITWTNEKMSSAEDYIRKFCRTLGWSLSLMSLHFHVNALRFLSSSTSGPLDGACSHGHR